MAKLTHTQCYAYFGTKPRNSQWSWSARSLDGKKIVVTFWQDQFEKGGRLYRSQVLVDPAARRRNLGLHELIENLAWARDHLDGMLHVVVAQPIDPHTHRRRAKECFPHKTLKMRVIELDETTGYFVAERIALEAPRPKLSLEAT